MKIAFLSDFHLGFFQPMRESEAFEQACSAMKQVISEKPDLIVLAGDLFDEAIPDQECWLEAFNLLSLPKNAPNSDVKISIKAKCKSEEENSIKSRNKSDEEKKEGISPENTPQVSFTGIPVISIHGTHEFRGKDFKNALHVLDAANALIYIHAQQAFITKNNETVVLHGLGGVPEKKAADVLHLFNPQAVSNASNILILHQSFKEFLPFDDEMIATLSMADLPADFDLIVDGHLHWGNELNENGRRLLVTGSTVITQMKKLESEKRKGFFIYDTKTKALQFKEIENQRQFYYKKFPFENASLQHIRDLVKDYVQEIMQSCKAEKPLIKIKLTGTLAHGLSSSDLDFSELLEAVSQKAVISIDKSFSKEDLKVKIQLLNELQKSKQSVIALGLEMLEQNLLKTSFDKTIDVPRFFSLLEEGELDKAIEVILNKKE